MSTKTARLIFYLGTLISLVLFLILTVDTHRQIQTLTHADRLSPQVVERVIGLGYMTAQAQMRFWFAILVVLGLSLLGGVILTVLDLLTLRPAPAAEKIASATG